MIKVPNAALRFRPTEEVFEALGQKAPERRQTPAAGRRAAVRDANDGRHRATASDREAVWVLEQGALARVSRCRAGISDGTQTAVVEQ